MGSGTAGDGHLGIPVWVASALMQKLAVESMAYGSSHMTRVASYAL